MRDMTARQREVLSAIGENLVDFGRAPTLREIGLKVGIKSVNGVNDHLMSLHRKGFIIRDEMIARGLRLTRQGIAALAGDETLEYKALPAEPSYSDVLRAAKKLPRPDLIRLQSQLLAMLLGEVAE